MFRLRETERTHGEQYVLFGARQRHGLHYGTEIRVWTIGIKAFLWEFFYMKAVVFFFYILSFLVWLGGWMGVAGLFELYNSLIFFWEYFKKRNKNKIVCVSRILF